MTLAHREEGPADGPVALMLHGYPESSYMWRDLLPAVAQAGWRGVAPDFAGFGDSAPDPPGTWERHRESVARFHEEHGLGQVVLVVHDWGGLIGLAWACDNPELVRGLVLSGTGFFPDGQWHGLAQEMRTEGKGEELLRNLDPGGFRAMMTQLSPGIDEEAAREYWRGYEGEDRRRAHLDFYRSMDFEKLAPYEGRLAALGVPALLLWGENDPFAPMSSAYRFERDLPDTELVVVEGTGHFVFDDAPEETAAAVTRFLTGLS